MSLKGDKYETVDEVKFRLESSVVLYDGKPVYISRVGMAEADDKKEIARVYFYDLPLLNGDKKGGGETRKYLSSRKFDLSPFKMGYMNDKGRATFVSRAPVRQNKQGLTSNVTTFQDMMGRRSEDVSFNTMIRSQGFVDMVAGKYPSFQECGDMLDNKDILSVALSRSFAFSIDHDLEALFLTHKGVRCGMVTRGQKAIKIPQKFHFLKEEMEEFRIPIA